MQTCETSHRLPCAALKPSQPMSVCPSGHSGRCLLRLCRPSPVGLSRRGPRGRADNSTPFRAPRQVPVCVPRPSNLCRFGHVDMSDRATGTQIGTNLQSAWATFADAGTKTHFRNLDKRRMQVGPWHVRSAFSGLPSDLRAAGRLLSCGL